AEAGGSPATCGDEGLDGLAKRLDVAHGDQLDRNCPMVNRTRQAAPPPAAGSRGYCAAPSGTTLPWLGAAPRNFLMLRAAWRMRCSFSTSASRTYWSPYSPNPTPGATATPVSSIRSLANSSEPRCAY